jgi:DUF2950 family protein
MPEPLSCRAGCIAVPQSGFQVTAGPTSETKAEAGCGGARLHRCGVRYSEHSSIAGFPPAPGGARSYVVNGPMRGGFAMIAWPAGYGESGVMTFIVGPAGVVYQKDLGPDTKTLAPAIVAFDPDSSWIAP